MSENFDITPHFKLIFLAVVCITVLSLIGIFILAVWGSHATSTKDIPVMQNNLYAACSFGWQSGLGAIFGLVGGKATSG